MPIALAPSTSREGSRGYGTGAYGRRRYGHGLRYFTDFPVVPPVLLIPPDADIQLSVVVCDRYGQRFMEIPSAIVGDVEWILNDIGTAKITFPTTEPRLFHNGEWFPRLLKDEIQIWLNGALLWWGVPLRLTGDSTTLSLACEDLLSYFARRFITTSSLDFGVATDGSPTNPVDQANIAIGLVLYAQGQYVNTQPHRNLNINIGNVLPTGVQRYRKYDRDKHEQILKLIQEFPTLENGFDFDIVSNDGQHRFFTLFYRYKGSFKPNLVMEFGRNISAYTYNEDAVSLANEAWATGGTVNNIKMENTYIDDAAAADRGIMQEIISVGSEIDPDTLLARATSEVNVKKQPVIMPEITSIDVPVQLFGQLTTGDSIPVRINDGRVQVSENYRIIKIKWNPDSPKEMTLTLNPDVVR